MPSENPTPRSQAEPTPDVSKSDHHLDLELMANVFVNPMKDLFHGTDSMDHDFITKHTALLFSIQYLLHQVLAMSGLQLFSQDRSRPDVYLRASYHQKEALILAQPHIGSTAEEHSLAKFFFAGYAAVCASAEMLFSQGHDRDNLIDVTVHSWGLARGIVIVSSTDWPRIQSSWAWPVVEKQIRAGFGYEPSPTDIPAYHMVRTLTFGVHPAESRALCLNAVENTFRSISLLQQCKDKELAVRLVSSWPIEISPGLDDLVTQRHPVALVIMAYYACMLHLVSELWWVGDWPHMLLQRTVNTLGDEWAEFLQWPFEISSTSEHNVTTLNRDREVSTPSG